MNWCFLKALRLCYVSVFLGERSRRCLNELQQTSTNLNNLNLKAVHYPYPRHVQQFPTRQVSLIHPFPTSTCRAPAQNLGRCPLPHTTAAPPLFPPQIRPRLPTATAQSMPRLSAHLRQEDEDRAADIACMS